MLQKSIAPIELSLNRLLAGIMHHDLTHCQPAKFMQNFPSVYPPLVDVV